jgi:hypothetical protein
MKKKDNYFLNKHKEWMEKGMMESCGLCFSIEEHTEALKLFQPIWGVDEWVGGWCGDGTAFGFWAKNGVDDNRKDGDNYCYCYGYTPLRQTIVLFCHEILNSTP